MQLNLANDDQLKIRSIKIVLVIILLLFSVLSPALARVVINEVELHPIGEYEQWVELYNTGDEELDISGWSISPLSNPSRELFIDLNDFPPGDFYVITSEYAWADPSGDALILRDYSGKEIDRTPILYDNFESSCTWTRYPDGSGNWSFLAPTRDGPTNGKSCEDVSGEGHYIRFNMEQKVGGSGFVSTRSSMYGVDNKSILSKQHGSGSYKSQEAEQYISDLINNYQKMGLAKNALSGQYSDATFNVTSNNRPIKYSSRWAESSMVNDEDPLDSSYISESTRYASSINSSLQVQSDAQVKAKMNSEFEGKSRVESSLGTFKSSEEYTGSFHVLNDILVTHPGAIESSVAGVGFVDVNRTIGDIVTYEKGTGAYQADELIDAGEGYLANDVTLSHSPVNYSYVPGKSINQSLMWRSGMRFGESDGPFVSSEFSDIKNLKGETIVDSRSDIRTTANFTGKASLKAALNSTPKKSCRSETIYVEDVFEGNYSINRKILIPPIYEEPHMSVVGPGRIHHPRCDMIQYAITLINDGNQALGPVYLKDTFPSGTTLMDVSLPPFEYTSRSANWSIPRLGIGSSVTIDLDLRITAPKDNYSNRLRAVTIFLAQTNTTASFRRLYANDATSLDADWSQCTPQKVPVSFTVTSDPLNPRLLTYFMGIQNLAGENISTNITATLPPYLKFINSTFEPSQINENTITWNIDRLAPDRRRTFNFMAESEQDGFIVSKANMHSWSLDGRELASINASASVVLGKFVDNVSATYSYDWLPCGGNMLSRLSWEDPKMNKGTLDCLCTGK
jgi:uncharacterized repeat protein (TIGR01451 family)